MIAEEENMHKETEKEDEKLKQEQEKGEYNNQNPCWSRRTS